MNYTKGLLRKVIYSLLILCLTLSGVDKAFSQTLTQTSTQTVFNLPAPNIMVPISAAHSEPVLTGVEIDTNNPFKLNFIVDRGNKNALTKEEAGQLIEYFLASLTIPEEDLWVNLSPNEPDRIINTNLSQTQMGKDLLSQDYILKQLTASVTYPESPLGKQYWDSVYTKMQTILGTTNLPVDTFNKVWITPKYAKVYEHNNKAVIDQASLKVVIEADYKASQNNQPITNNSRYINQNNNGLSKLAQDTLKQIILPQIEKDVNSGANFAKLRQIYHSFILASWFKKKLKDTAYQYYIDKNRTDGINLDDKTAKEKIYNLYLEAYQKGLYNYIRKDANPINHKTLSRRYYSGGVELSAGNIETETNLRKVDTALTDPANHALTVKIGPHDERVKAVAQKDLTTFISEKAGELKANVSKIVQGDLPAGMSKEDENVMFHIPGSSESEAIQDEKIITWKVKELPGGLSSYNLKVGISPGRSKSGVEIIINGNNIRFYNISEAQKYQIFNFVIELEELSQEDKDILNQANVTSEDVQNGRSKHEIAHFVVSDKLSEVCSSGPKNKEFKNIMGIDDEKEKEILNDESGLSALGLTYSEWRNKTIDMYIEKSLEERSHGLAYALQIIDNKGQLTAEQKLQITRNKDDAAWIKALQGEDRETLYQLVELFWGKEARRKVEEAEEEFLKAISSPEWQSARNAAKEIVMKFKQSTFQGKTFPDVPNIVNMLTKLLLTDGDISRVDWQHGRDSYAFTLEYKISGSADIHFFKNSAVSEYHNYFIFPKGDKVYNELRYIKSIKIQRLIDSALITPTDHGMDQLLYQVKQYVGFLLKYYPEDIEYFLGALLDRAFKAYLTNWSMAGANTGLAQSIRFRFLMPLVPVISDISGTVGYIRVQFKNGGNDTWLLSATDNTLRNNLFRSIKENINSDPRDNSLTLAGSHAERIASVDPAALGQFEAELKRELSPSIVNLMKRASLRDEHVMAYVMLGGKEQWVGVSTQPKYFKSYNNSIIIEINEQAMPQGLRAHSFDADIDYEGRMVTMHCFIVPKSLSGDSVAHLEKQAGQIDTDVPATAGAKTVVEQIKKDRIDHELAHKQVEGLIKYFLSKAREVAGENIRNEIMEILQVSDLTQAEAALRNWVHALAWYLQIIENRGNLSMELRLQIEENRGNPEWMQAFAREWNGGQGRGIHHALARFFWGEKGLEFIKKAEEEFLTYGGVKLTTNNIDVKADSNFEFNLPPLADIEAFKNGNVSYEILSIR